MLSKQIVIARYFVVKAERGDERKDDPMNDQRSG
jgi:hypothetical protein